MYNNCTRGTQWLWQEYGCYLASESWDRDLAMGNLISGAPKPQAGPSPSPWVVWASAQVSLLQRFYDPLGLGLSRIECAGVEICGNACRTNLHSEFL